MNLLFFICILLIKIFVNDAILCNTTDNGVENCKFCLHKDIIDNKGNLTNFIYCNNENCKSKFMYNTTEDFAIRLSCCSQNGCDFPEITDSAHEDLQHDEIGRCPLEWTYHAGNCFKSFNEQVDFYEAYFKCRLHKTGDLASITSVYQQKFLQYTGLSSFDQYIGLNDVRTEGQYEWTDGSLYEYANFDSGEPNNHGDEDCVKMCNNGKWYDIDCHTKLGYLCKRSAVY